MRDIQTFSQALPISWIHFMGVGWGGGIELEVRAGGELKISFTIHWNRKTAIMHSMNNTNSHNLHVRLRQSLTALVLHQMYGY